LNNITLIGNLTKDLELKYLPTNNTPVVNYTLAVNNPFRKDEEGNTTADFINCVTFGKQAENLATYMAKGCKVAVNGRLQVRQWQDQEGNNRYSTEVVTNSVEFLTYPKENTNNDMQDDFDNQDLPF
jgi:single-strand DNA-binding protein